jgi:polysaccharide export outer membrane protein
MFAMQLTPAVSWRAASRALLPLAVLWLGNAAPAAELDSPALAAQPLAAVFTNVTTGAGARAYRLSPNDMVLVKVYQEDDLTTTLRLAKDGSATFPLLGVINLGGKSVDEAASLIRDLLGRDYLVNPQVTVTVTEYAKRRFTVLGQVQKPGTYEIPNEETVNILQAIAMAGGYTRLASQGKVAVSRTLGGKQTLLVDVKSAAQDPNAKSFEILPDDIIQVSERVF